jgi:hypothetical protein
MHGFEQRSTNVDRDAVVRAGVSACTSVLFGAILDPKFEEQLVGNTFLTPGSITQSHYTDDCAKFGRYSWPAWP